MKGYDDMGAKKSGRKKKMYNKKIKRFRKRFDDVKESIFLSGVCSSKNSVSLIKSMECFR